MDENDSRCSTFDLDDIESDIASAGYYAYKDSAEVASQYREQGSGCISSGMTIIDVAAGDIIYLKARCQIAASIVPNNNSVGLNIMYIK